MSRIRLLSTVGVIAGLLAVFSMLLFAQDSVTDHPVRMPVDFDKAFPQYAKGANDALDAIKRITARLPDGTNLTMEAVCELVCKELNIERRAVSLRPCSVP
jgi:hypothetical protein